MTISVTNYVYHLKFIVISHISIWTQTRSLFTNSNSIYKPPNQTFFWEHADLNT